MTCGLRIIQSVLFHAQILAPYDSEMTCVLRVGGAVSFHAQCRKPDGPRATAQSQAAKNDRTGTGEDQNKTTQRARAAFSRADLRE